MQPLTPISFAVLAAVSTPAVAEDTGPDHAHPHDHAVPELIITADPLGEVDGHFVAPATVLDARALRTESMRSIGEAVAGQLGVSSSDFGTGVGRPVIRGLGGGRVRVLDGGIGSFDVSTVSADHAVSVEPIFAEQIEILRGPATLLYGSGASGGLINVVNGRINRTLPEDVEAEAYGHYDSASDGSLGAFRIDGALGGHLALHLDGMVRGSDDIDIPGFAERTPDADERPGTLPNSDADSDALSAGASWIGARGFLGFSVSRMANEYGVPGTHAHEHEGEEEEEEPGAGTRIDLEQTRYDVDAAWDVERFGVHRLKARWGYNDYEHDEVEASGELGTRFTNSEWEGRLEAVLEPLGRFDGAIGVQLRDKDFAAVGEEAFVPPATLDSIAVFVFEKAEFGDVHVDAGLRYESQEADSRVVPGTVEHELVSVSGGAAWHHAPGYAAGLSFARAERAPTIEELFAGGPHLATSTFEFGNAALDEETSFNVDLFWRRTTGRLRFDFTVFYNAIDDFVFLAANDRNGDGVADRVEDDFLDTGAIVDEPDALLLVDQRSRDATFWGFELAGEATLLDDARGRLDARLWSDYVDGELDGGATVPRLTPLRFGGDLDYERGPLYARFRVERVTAADDPAPLETATDGYTLVSLDLGYTLERAGRGALTLFARGTNLADETARRHTSFVKDLAPLPGASGLVGVRLSY